MFSESSVTEPEIQKADLVSELKSQISNLLAQNEKLQDENKSLRAILKDYDEMTKK